MTIAGSLRGIITSLSLRTHITVLLHNILLAALPGRCVQYTKESDSWTRAFGSIHDSNLAVWLTLDRERKV